MTHSTQGQSDPAAILAARRQATSVAFHQAVAALGWHLLAKGEMFRPSPQGQEFVVGVALWSQPDLECLEAFARAVGSSRVHIFQFDDCLTTTDLAAVAPGIGPVWKTPVVIEYRSGRLVRWRQGTDPNPFDWAESQESTVGRG